MNTKIIHLVIAFILLSLTAHEVHTVVIHDVETCDVCIQIQSNDDGSDDASPQYIELDLAFHLKTKAENHTLKLLFQTTADYIRGPPTLS